MAVHMNFLREGLYCFESVCFVYDSFLFCCKESILVNPSSQVNVKKIFLSFAKSFLKQIFFQQLSPLSNKHITLYLYPIEFSRSN